MIIQLPVTTEFLEKIDDLNPSRRAENNQIHIEFDTRKRDYRQVLGLPRKTKIGLSNERTFDVHFSNHVKLSKIWTLPVKPSTVLSIKSHL